MSRQGPGSIPVYSRVWAAEKALWCIEEVRGSRFANILLSVTQKKERPYFPFPHGKGKRLDSVHIRQTQRRVLACLENRYMLIMFARDVTGAEATTNCQ
jgi:hypothetical protein